MKTQHDNFFHSRPTRSRRIGLTLIEVIAALALLATLLSAVVMARGRFARQWALADRRIAAGHAADTLLTGWMSADRIPLTGEGQVPSRSGSFSWRISPVANVSADSLKKTTVRLELFDSSQPIVSQPSVPLISIQLLAPGAGSTVKDSS